MKNVNYLLTSILSVTIAITSIAQTKNIKSKKVKKPKTVTTASGLQYTITKKGDGLKPVAGDLVKVSYYGKLLNGVAFDSSTNFSFKLGVGQVIKGWDEAVAQLQEGDKAKLVIPASMGYGDRQVGSIPPKSTLLFDVELLDVKFGLRPWIAPNKDTLTTPSGLKYLIFETGTGDVPKQGDKVKVNYSGFFRDGKLFDSSVERNQPFEFKVGVGQVIKGWDEAFLNMKKGAKYKLIIPYTLAYGEDGRPPQIPRKSDLIFDVEMLDFKPKISPKAFDITSVVPQKTASGLEYYVVQKGAGGKAESGKNVSIHYTGYLPDGTIFDSSIEREQPLNFNVGVGQMIKGFDEGILLMQVGDKFRFNIPYQLAYGEKGAPPYIPGKTNLTFDVELLEMR